jgi:cytochrome bd-type quinol oxidase subunit 2
LITPFLKLIRDRPDLLASHFNAYLQIAQDELMATRHHLVQQIVLWIVTAVLVLATLLFFGFAAMLVLAQIVPADMRLFAVPLITALCALASWILAKTSRPRASDGRLAAHLRQDMDLLKRLG